MARYKFKYLGGGGANDWKTVDTDQDLRQTAGGAKFTLVSDSQTKASSTTGGGAAETSTTGTTGTTNIPFKGGLSQEQKDSITNLLNKPVGTWNATDKANWNHATNNATLPKEATLYGADGTKEVVNVGSTRASQLQSQGWGLTAGSYKAPGGNSVNDLTKGTGDVTKIDINSASDKLKKHPIFINGNDEFKRQLIIQEAVNQLTKDQDKQEWLDALEWAKNKVDPYYAQIITVTQDEILRGFTDIEAANKQRTELLDRSLARIEEDLATGTERMTFDQQSSLVKLKKQYENQFVDLLNETGNAGMAFSSRAGDLLSRSAQEKRDVQTSTKRSFGRQMQDIQTQAQRSTQDQESFREEQKRLRMSDLTALARQSEKALGTQSWSELTGQLDSELQDILGGIGKLGGISGTIGHQKDLDIITTAQGSINADNINL